MTKARSAAPEDPGRSSTCSRASPGMGRVLVAFSGGRRQHAPSQGRPATVLGENVLAVIAGSETYPEREVRAAGAWPGKLESGTG